ncbi:MAG: HD domain-containing protein [Gammaproteobacteria bacterium]|nr:HD domain-containing protein [Gammaproteobacteria bacterium]
MEEIDKILNCIIEVEKLKSVYRKTRPVGLNRHENAAEHSWHVCLSALLLKDYANEVIAIDRVIKMLLIHDLGEIDAGDTIIYESEKPEIKKAEADGLARILQLLPEGKATEYSELWDEFEAGKTAEAKYARAIDRIPPLLQNLYSAGHSWKENNIPQEKVFAVNSRIAAGCLKVWNNLQAKLENAVASGILK